MADDKLHFFFAVFVVLCTTTLIIFDHSRSSEYSGIITFVIGHYLGVRQGSMSKPTC